MQSHVSKPIHFTSAHPLRECGDEPAIVGNRVELQLLTTLRCNHKCLYCQAGAAPAGGNGTDMSRKVARKIASKGPLAIAQAKRAINWGADADLRASNELEQQAFSLLFGTEDQKEGMKAFLEKRTAKFAGR